MNKKKIFKNIAWLLFDKVLRILGGLFIGIWIARYLGPSDFGVLNYAIAYISLFVVFSKIGLEKIVIREIVLVPDDKSIILGTAFILKLFGSSVAIVCISLSTFLLEVNITTKYVIVILSYGYLFQTFDVIDYFYQSRILSKYTVVARNIPFVLISIFKIFLILNKYNVIYFAIAATLELFIVCIFFLLIYWKKNEKIFSWKFSKKKALYLLKSSWPLAISSFLIAIYMKIDQIMIGNMLNLHDVGIYSVAVRLSESWLFFPTIIISTLMPYFIDLRKKNLVVYKKRLMMLYSFMFWIGIVVGVIVFLFGKKIIILFFGTEYTKAFSALVFNIWSGVAISQGLARGIWLISEDLQMFRLFSNIIGVLLNIILNLILIPKYGITGAAIATLLTQSFSTWIFSFLWKPLRVSTSDMLKSINPRYLLNIGNN